MAGAREVYQKLKDVCLGVAKLNLHGNQRWCDLHAGLVTINIDGWIISLCKEAGNLDHCAGCTLPDGHQLDSRHWANPGTDPLELLSVWERNQLETALQALQ